MPSPWQTPPSELLSEIFVACLPQHDSDRLDPAQAPLLLCGICSYWRDAALAEHRLWDTVLFPATKHDSPRGRYLDYRRFLAAGGVQRWFDRTGTTHLLAFGEEASEFPQSSYITLFLPVVTKYARRLRRLDIVMTKITNFEYLRRGFPHGIFDELVDVGICCSVAMTPRELEGFTRLDTPFKDAKKLREVRFRLTEAIPRRFVLPWAQLKRVRVDYARRVRAMGVTEWEDVFRDCTGLERCEFATPIYRERRDRESREVVRSSVKTLVLFDHDRGSHWWDASPAWSILREPSVVFPKLTHLELVMYTTPEAVPKALFACLKTLERLETLKIRSDKASPPQPDPPGRALAVPPSVLALVSEMVGDPMALRNLKEVALPYQHYHNSDIGILLRCHAPAGDYPGLRVVVYTDLEQIDSWKRYLEDGKFAGVKDRLAVEIPTIASLPA
ncbi:hypothetical protein DFP72DRAFT_1115478 [Ephemerocybe angulata]|uniref:F-box domain-containing protein n=1 Tax=Ephemerocybe angulata TaxID=980116 RepID=A0A8H6I0I1_9AGAR|nr:hypothetical protein DFP72DRAFT_1115478 [Tulosesus angulatus]